MMLCVHLTSGHRRNDTRIFIKQCRSLAEHGYEVTFVVADQMGDEFNQGIKILDVGCLPGRINRMIRTTQRVFNKAISLDETVLYHLHEPEMIPIGLRLKKLGKKVIFDSHEDLPRQLLSKPYLGPITSRILSLTFSLYERYSCGKFDGIIAATPFIRDKFLAINHNTIDINNYPLISELFDTSVQWSEKQKEVCYVGGISILRGIREVVRAFDILKSHARLNLVGLFSSALENEVRSFPGWNSVNELGFLDRLAVRAVLARSMAGLVTFHPEPNHIDAQPNKMFEYMSAGIPVIASNFPLWRDIIEKNKCGFCVDPLDPRAIANAIDYLMMYPDIARQMGENGRQAVLSKYNWPIEEQKLLNFYSQILGKEI